MDPTIEKLDNGWYLFTEDCKNKFYRKIYWGYTMEEMKRLFKALVNGQME